MATRKSTLKVFSVSAQLNIWASITIEAESLEDAVTKSRELGVTDFVAIDGEHIDSQHMIIGVSAEDLPQLDI